MLVIKIS